MFLYWDGYEIDGSDSSFDVVLPESVQNHDFFKCFLDMPIFSNIPLPLFHLQKQHISGHNSGKKRKISKDEFMQRLLTGDFANMSFSINCQHPEMLPPQCHAQVYALSQGRDPHEEAYGKAQNPCTRPIIQKDFDRGSMTIDVYVRKIGPDWHWRKEEYDGPHYKYNFDAAKAANEGDITFEMFVGPSAYYEYAMYIVEYMRQHFPSIAIHGGLDCGGGWTDGCTYADSLYAYEKIHLPVRHNIRHTLKWLTKYGIIRSFRRYYSNSKSKGFQAHHVYTIKGFYPAKGWGNVNPPAKEEEMTIPFDQYVELAELATSNAASPHSNTVASDTSHSEAVVSDSTSSFDQVVETAVDIILPQPETYAQNPNAVKLLQEALPDNPRYARYKEWQFSGYMAFTTWEGRQLCELRIRYDMKKYLTTLLNLAESGQIEFIKQEVYDTRHE